MQSKKATTLEEIDQAVKFNEPIGPDHVFYTKFSDIRGDFEEKIIYKNLNVKIQDEKYTFNASLNSSNKALLFLGGMRGTGKTSELARYAQNMNHPDCFLCITCNIDEELDMNDVEYMDILIFQLEKLTKRLQKEKVSVNKGILTKMEKWFQERSVDITNSLKGEAGLKIGVVGNGLLAGLIGIFGELKIGFTGSRERAETIRKTFKNRFPEFAGIFNEYLEEVNHAIRKKGIAQEVFFIVDGLEKTMTAETRRKIIIEESNRLQQIKAYTIFTLPVELMKERQKLNQFSNVESFPFVKLLERDGTPIEKAFKRFFEFVHKRIDASLFESDAVIRKAITYSGGSPRELLRILELTAFYADDKKGKIDMAALDKALSRLSRQMAQYLTEEMLQKLIEIKTCNDKGMDVTFDSVIQEMLENLLVMEYNSGNYKRVHPLLELSDLYKQRVNKK